MNRDVHGSTDVVVWCVQQLESNQVKMCMVKDGVGEATEADMSISSVTHYRQRQT